MCFTYIAFIFNVSNPNRYDKKSPSAILCVCAQRERAAAATYNIEWVKLNICTARESGALAKKNCTHAQTHTCEREREIRLYSQQQ